MVNNKADSLLGEEEFTRRLSFYPVDCVYVDKWYDFEVEGIPVEVKTTRISHKFSRRCTEPQSYKIGRFDFTDRQRREKIYTAFLVRNESEFLFLGVALIKENSPRYISLHKIREYRLMSLDSFVDRIRRLKNVKEKS